MNKRFVIIKSEDVNKINFSEVMETGPFSLRYSVDKTKTFVKYNGDQPTCLFNIAGDAIGLPEYTYEEFLEILKKPEWNRQD